MKQTEVFESLKIKNSQDNFREQLKELAKIGQEIGLNEYWNEYEFNLEDIEVLSKHIEEIKNLVGRMKMKMDLEQKFEYLKTKFEEANQKHDGFGNSEEMDLITKQMYDSVGFQKANEFFDHLDDLPCGL